MSPLSVHEAQNMPGATMLDSSGAKIGKVADVYIDSDTQTPEWALVHTGLFGGRESFVPLAQARLSGDDLTVPYAKSEVKDAPNAEPDGELSQEEEARLYAHYGLNYSDAPSGSGLPTTGAPAAAPRGGGDRGRVNDGGFDDLEKTAVGRDTSGSTTDDAMTRSEERLRVGVQKRPSQTVRLRKHIVRENVTTTVPVSKERATVTREPITEVNRAAAMRGVELTEGEHEVVLREERPVVTKETVPVERIRLDKDLVTEEQTVTEQVRKEQIEVEDTTGGTPRGRR